jgi:hypothetical protein
VRGPQYDSLDITDAGLAYGGTLSIDLGPTFLDQSTFLVLNLPGTVVRSGSFARVGAIGSKRRVSAGIGEWQ